MDSYAGWILAVCVVAVRMHTGACKIHSGHFSSLKKIDSVNIDHRLIHHDRQRRSTGPVGDWPKEIYTRIADVGSHGVTGNYDVILRFKPLEGGRVSPLVHRDDSGEKVEHVSEISNCTMFYEDLHHGAHAMVDICDDGFAMVAELYLDGGHHVILPKEGVSDDGGVANISKWETTHCLYSADASIEFLNDYSVFPARDGTDSRRNPKTRSKRAATGSYIVELMLVIDYTLFDYWYQMTSSAKTNNARKADALDLIQSFYTFIARGINFRYQKAIEHNLNIKTELSQIYVIKRADQSTITVTSSHVSGVRDAIDGDTTLSSFTAWVADKRTHEQGFLVVDHHMLLTDQDLEIQGQNSAGIAAWKQVCTSRSVSVVEGRFEFITAVIAAHEIGHSLGGSHDGDGNVCDSADSYVLATVNQVQVDVAKRDNPFRFSTCSIQAFVATIEQLDASGLNCLLVDNVGPVVAADGQPTGQLYHPDVQCQKVFGADAVMSRLQNINTNYEQICTGMVCIVSGSTAQVILPADGTSCGHKKWCENGVCIQSDDAPPDTDYCLYGDQPGTLQSGDTCDGAATAFLGRCYNENFRIQCCGTCKDRKLTVQDCDYGDTNNCAVITDFHCYNDSISTPCCKTCHDAKLRHSPYSHIQDCTYGDHVSNCASNVATPVHAPSPIPTQDIPPTCSKIYCTYGDHVSNCASNVAMYCRQFPARCCETCSDPIGTPPSSQATQRPPSQGTPPTSTPARTTQAPEKSDGLPDWVIPVAGGAGGLLVLILIIVLIYNVCCRQRSKPKRGRHDNRKKQDVRRRSHDSQGRSYEHRDRSRDRNYDNRGYHNSPDKYRRGSHDRGYNRY